MRRLGVTRASAFGRSRAWRSRMSPRVWEVQLMNRNKWGQNNISAAGPSSGSVDLTPFLGLAHPLSRCQLLLDRLDLGLASAFGIELDAAIDGALAEAHGERRRLADRFGDFPFCNFQIGNDASREAGGQRLRRGQ